MPLGSEVAEHSDAVDDSFLQGRFPVAAQRALARDLLSRLPHEKSSMWLGESAHPVSTPIAIGDVRITTRYAEREFASSLFSTLHEFGHALYETGIDPALERTPLSDLKSLGLHESQSRIWENAVGRSLAFWRYFYPRVEETFPNQLAGIGAERFHRAVNKVQRSLIRVEADELTYDLHIVLRFELEREIFSGALAPRDLPAAWNERVRSYLGLDVPNDAAGVLQDIHWAEGAFGYFPTYSLGNVIAGQLWQAINEAIPDLDEQIERGEFRPLREWLREHVHRHGRKLSAAAGGRARHRRADRHRRRTCATCATRSLRCTERPSARGAERGLYAAAILVGVAAQGRRTIQLVREAFAGPAGVDTARLAGDPRPRSGGELPETMRLARPGAMVAFGKQDVNSAGYAEAVAAARAAPVRGGRAAGRRAGGGVPRGDDRVRACGRRPDALAAARTTAFGSRRR